MTDQAPEISQEVVTPEAAETEVPAIEPESTAAKEPEAEGEPSTEDLPLPEPEEISDKDKNKDFIIKRKEKQLARKAAETEALRAQLEEVSRRQQMQPVIQPQPAAAPARDDFDNEDAWLDARLDYREKVKTQEIGAQRYQQFVEQQQQKDREAFEKMQDNGSTKYSDFEDVIHPIMDPRGDFPTNEALGKAIFHSDFGDDILYFFGKNYDHAKKIANMNAIDAVKEVARLELRFKEKRSAKKVTKNEYQPMESLKGGASAGAVTTGKLENMNQKDFEEFYKKNFNKKRF